MEYLTFDSNGQWSLRKAVGEPFSEQPKKMLATAPKVDKPYQVYTGNTLTGELHEDRGQKGTLHNFNGGTRQKSNWNRRTAGKTPHPVRSVVAERNPGLGEDEA